MALPNMNLNMPGLLALARSSGEDSFWTRLGYEL